MKAVRIHAWSAAPQLEEVPEPLPREGESLVRVHAAGVGHLDRTIWRGRFLHSPALPWTPGVEGSGVVVRSRSFEPGTRVWFRGAGLGTQRDGTWCEYVSVPDTVLGRIPAAVSFEAAATFFSPCTSAWVALHEVARLQAGERVLVTGATGAVGAVACALALETGAQVVAVVGSADRLRHVTEGARAVVVDRSAPRMPEGLQADLLVDTVGGRLLEAALPSVTPGGRAVLVGYLGGSRLELDIAEFIQRDVALLPLNMIRREAAGRAAAAQLLERIGAGALQVACTRFALADAGAALAWLEAPGHRGRAVLVVRDH